MYIYNWGYSRMLDILFDVILSSHLVWISAGV